LFDFAWTNAERAVVFKISARFWVHSCAGSAVSGGLCGERGRFLLYGGRHSVRPCGNRHTASFAEMLVAHLSGLSGLLWLRLRRGDRFQSPSCGALAPPAR